MPIILISRYLRIRYDVQFESMNQTVFAECSKFATEAIGAVMTVSSLTLEGSNCRIRNMRPSSEDEGSLLTEVQPFESENMQGVTVEFNNISFRYPTRDVAVLDGLNMIVSAP